ncbi:MAG: flagellar biosynthetic protein FliQ [Bdellovibrionota bacterium]|jgi:type III secretory pathway component EscS
MELNIFGIIIRMFLIVGVPITGFIVGFGLFGSLLTSLFSIQDETLNYALRFVGALFGFLLMGSAMGELFLEETRVLFLQIF